MIASTVCVASLLIDAGLFTLTTSLVAIKRRDLGLPHTHAPSVASKATRAAAWLAALMLSVLAVSWPDGDSFAQWRFWLVTMPANTQRSLGLALALAPAYAVAQSWLAAPRSRTTHTLAAVACAAWVVFYARLPMHLSSQDFDDFFVVGKFVGAVTPGWFNDKPLFTFWDLPYRLYEGTGDALERFRINGWFALVYLAAAGLWIERMLPDLLEPSLAARAPRWVPFAAALQLGPVVLSHSLFYELPCAAWVLSLSLLLERMRDAPTRPHTLEPVAVLALARLLQAGGHNATAMAWLPVYLHGFIVLRSLRASHGALAWAAALLASGVLDLVSRERGVENVWHSFERSRLDVALVGGVIPLLVALLWMWRRPRGDSPPAPAARAWLMPSGVRAWHVYLLCGAAIYLAGNTAKFGIVVPGFSELCDGVPWDWATNHARYALFVYPFFVMLLVRLLLPRGNAGLAALAAFFVLWNLAYVTRFYAAPGGPRANDVSYQRNTRFLAAMRARLPELGGGRTVAYLPIPRDHGDHYLARVADPSLDMVAACDPMTRLRPNLPLVLSGYTAHVIEKESPLRVFVAARALTRHADVVVLRMRDLAPRELDRWCDQVERGPVSGVRRQWEEEHLPGRARNALDPVLLGPEGVSP